MIKVPEGMLKAAHKAWGDHRDADSVVAVVRYELEAALGWLAQNPIRPTDQQAAQLWKVALELDPDRNEDTNAASNLVLAWQRMMFRDQETPEERVVRSPVGVGHSGEILEWEVRLDGTRKFGGFVDPKDAEIYRVGLIATLKQEE